MKNNSIGISTSFVLIPPSLFLYSVQLRHVRFTAESNTAVAVVAARSPRPLYLLKQPSLSVSIFTRKSISRSNRTTASPLHAPLPRRRYNWTPTYQQRFQSKIKHKHYARRHIPPGRIVHSNDIWDPVSILLFILLDTYNSRENDLNIDPWAQIQILKKNLPKF